MVNKILATTVAAGGLFLGTGILELVYAIVIKGKMDDTPSSGRSATRRLLNEDLPLNAAIANAGIIMFAFFACIPGFIFSNRRILTWASYLVMISAVFTVCVGVDLWVMTLTIKGDFFKVYARQDSDVQSMIQTSFECCGYHNSTVPAFITDEICPSPAAAALLRGCGTAISHYANNHIDTLFTALFGMSGVAAVFLLCIACLLKDRKERERYRIIDQKTDFQNI